MSGFVPIDKLSMQIGLTSRTLRHWEAQGLFKSQRDSSSGWRVYDQQAILAIQVTALLRRLDIGIKDIRNVVQDMSFQSMYTVLSNHSEAIVAQKSDFELREGEIRYLLQLLSAHLHEPITDTLLLQFNESSLLQSNKPSVHNPAVHNEEALSVRTKRSNHIHVRFVTLPPMRFAYHIAVSTSPEEEAMLPVLSWLKAAQLMGTARLFGGNMPPHPSGHNKPYGYGMCASIPESVEIPDSLKELRFDGGLYAVTESSDDIGSSWRALMDVLKENPDYQADSGSRLCLEEHIRNDSPEGSGNQYLLNLFEPVRKR